MSCERRAAAYAMGIAMTPISDMLQRCLADLDARLDDAQEERNRDQWSGFLDERFEGEVFTPARREPSPPRVSWPSVTVNRAIADSEAMLLQQFAAVSDILAQGGSQRLNVRCNYGTGILPSLFGCEPFFLDESAQTLPTARPLGSRDRVAALLDAGLPDVHGGLAERVFQAADLFLEVFRRHPKLARNIELYHPDMQGPIDVAELVWGSEMFLAFYDDPALVREALALFTQTYAAFAAEWFRRVGPPRRHNAHWGLAHAGALVLRNDSLMNLSPDVYVRFIRPMDQRLFDQFGGGVVHFCGRGDHFIAAMSEMTGLSAVHLSQPELNDMETIYRHTVDRGIRLLELRRETIEAARRDGRPLRGLVHCRNA